MKEILLVTMLYVASLVCLAGEAGAQTYQPYQPAPSYAIYWQPVRVPGYYYQVPRTLPVLDAVFGPRLIFVPQHSQQQQQP